MHSVFMVMNGMLLFNLISVSIINIMTLRVYGPNKNVFCVFALICFDIMFNCCKNMFFTCIENIECEDILVQGKIFTMFQ